MRERMNDIYRRYQQVSKEVSEGERETFFEEREREKSGDNKNKLGKIVFLTFQVREKE